MRMSPTIVAAVLTMSFVAAPAVRAAPAPDVSVVADGLGAGGYDVTTYFTAGSPVLGNAAYQAQYKGATWRFASAAAKAKFLADPAAFAPQFGGYCAWATSQGYLAPGNPQQWKVVDGKLYLNFNARAKELWEADQAAAIQRGHTNWPAVLTKNQNS
jgi:YHS domain-containing protein